MKNQATTPHTSACESNAIGSEKKSKNRWFTLTRKNQKGQVAIFVALIFQVIFVFFALLINVGLLVHHKINLQQSTDLAAYYGAMKQAEMLNVIGHVNFQIRQAWKLLTWRYRILGTFGQIWTGSDVNPDLPIKISSAVGVPLVFTNTDIKCGGALGGLYNGNDIPVYCFAHVGFSDWPPSTNETQCKVDCGILNGAAVVIPSISGVGNFSGGGANVGGAINSAITTANTLGADLCLKTTIAGASNLANILASYFSVVDPHKKLIQILGKNLSGEKSKFTDLDGKLVELGANNTFKNNLTEANLSSIDRFEVLNGLSDDNSSNGGCSDLQTTLAEIKFQIIQYYLRVCDAPVGANIMQNARVESVYSSTGNNLNPAIKNILDSNSLSSISNLLNNLIQTEISLGYEKNPWCQSYYGIRTSASPKIPFLPISKIKLNAISFAKPFGGTIGPWYFDKWESGGVASASANKTDKKLPNKTVNSGGAANPKDNIDITLNYSNYVGDSYGLSDPKYIGFYHDLLLNRNISANSMASSNKGPLDSAAGVFKKASFGSPKITDWQNISKDMNEPDFDPLTQTNNSNSYMRDLELSVVAPNQFDLTYYSIDSDYYNNYYNKKIGDQAKINNLASLYSIPTPVSTFPDFGFSKQNISGVPSDYSVRHQLAVVEQVFRAVPPLITTASQVVDKYFTFIPKTPASLLTGWTFMNMTNEAGYTTFPNANSAMKFGKCEDGGAAATVNANYQSLTSVSLPPTPGNCVTGGRTGYSVKIVSQDAINGPQGDIGGPGTGGAPIRNPIPDSFLNFQ